jgi:hypothetical protein
MKRKPLSLLIFAIVMMMASSVHAQDRISFIHESGEEIYYDAKFLAEIIYTSDTLMGDDELLLSEYESMFPPQKGCHEPAILVLLPDDYDFYVIVIQEDRKGKVLALRILTRDGWMEADRQSLLTLKKYI